MWSSGGRHRIFFLAALLFFVWTAGTAAAADDEECYRCHGLDGFFARDGGEVRQAAVSRDFFESSVHSLLNCRECHAEIAAIPHLDASSGMSCGQVCHQRDRSGNLYSHESLFWSFVTSVHGETQEERISCMVCHPSTSLTGISRRNLGHEVKECAACHSEEEHVRRYFLDVHYLALSQGNRRAPSCPDCHTAHRILAQDDSESSTHSSRMAGTCSSGAIPSGREGRCHDGAGEDSFAGAGMSTLVLPGKSPGVSGWLFSIVYWTMLLGLILRVGVGLLKGR